MTIISADAFTCPHSQVLEPSGAVDLRESAVLGVQKARGNSILFVQILSTEELKAF